MQVSEQKERATGSGPSDFTIYHRVSRALRRWSHTRVGWGGVSLHLLQSFLFTFTLIRRKEIDQSFILKCAEKEPGQVPLVSVFHPPSLPHQPGRSSVFSGCLRGPGAGVGSLSRSLNVHFCIQSCDRFCCCASW